ncbi:SctD/MshK family protein [Bradyrhizobium sp. USDA 4353]
MIELQVQSGHHTGVVERLTNDSYTIGRSVQADISLADPTISDMAVRVEADVDELRVENLGAAVDLNDTRILTGDVGIARFPSDLVIDGVCLRWQRPASHLSGMRRAVQTMAGVSALAVAVMLVSFIASGSGSQAPAGVVAAACEAPCASQPPDEDLRLAAVTFRPDADRTVVSTPETAAAALRQRLSAVGLTAIDVSVEAKAVVARGATDPAALPAWQQARQWFDETFGTSVVLISKVETRQVPAMVEPLSVQSIWAGKVPYVIDQRGQKLFQGSLVNDGWSIERIERGRITLRRSAQVFVLQL